MFWSVVWNCRGGSGTPRRGCSVSSATFFISCNSSLPRLSVITCCVYLSSLEDFDVEPTAIISKIQHEHAVGGLLACLVCVPSRSGVGSRSSNKPLLSTGLLHFHVVEVTIEQGPHALHTVSLTVNL